MIRLGTFNTLTILRRTDPGIYLEGDEKTGDILLPQRFVTPQMNIGDQLEVFIYLDQEERIIATTETPLARVGEFAFLQVAWTNQYGAFLHWGLMKDLFCPFREQKQRMQRGKGYIVYIKEDEATHRLMATAKVEKYLSVPFAAMVSQHSQQQHSQQQNDRRQDGREEDDRRHDLHLLRWSLGRSTPMVATFCIRLCSRTRQARRRQWSR